ncbi:MAG: FAD-binding protein [Chloroflexi bacterium]|nr:FAD-binding protein [Chloroflexota bacterium]
MLDAAILKSLQEIVGRPHVLTSPEDLIAYSYDGTTSEHRPQAVVCPASTAEVAAVLAVAHTHGLPVTPRGMGSGLAGGSVPGQGGLALPLTRMNRILEIDKANMTATVEAGVVTADLQATVEAQGLFYPPDPASIRQSTVGGNVATNAGGPRCVKYGVTRDYVLGLTVALADGRTLRLGGKYVKNVTAGNLMHLFVGSEGILGVVTEATVRLLAQPQEVRTALVVFPHLDDASVAIQRTLRSGVVPSTIEMMDQTTINTVEEYMHLGLPLEAEALLIVEVDGQGAAEVEQAMQTVADTCRAFGASEVRVAADEAQRNALWQARRAVGPSVSRRAPDVQGEDISLPISAIPEAIRRINGLPARFGLPMVIYGHAGDGNLHPNILFDRRNPTHPPIVEQMIEEVFRIAVELGGTLSGEHGIGTSKQRFMGLALGPEVLQALQEVKQALDPKGILNPGKVFPPEMLTSGRGQA